METLVLHNNGNTYQNGLASKIEKHGMKEFRNAARKMIIDKVNIYMMARKRKELIRLLWVILILVLKIDGLLQTPSAKPLISLISIV